MVIASYAAGNPRAERIAEWIAGERRAGDHPDAHVEYDPDRDDFTVVADSD